MKNSVKLTELLAKVINAKKTKVVVKDKQIIGPYDAEAVQNLFLIVYGDYNILFDSCKMDINTFTDLSWVPNIIFKDVLITGNKQIYDKDGSIERLRDDLRHFERMEKL